jgi:hypothetical protein
MKAGLGMARRASNRMAAQPSYHSFNRMQRRRTYPDRPSDSSEPASATEYATELELLARLHADGLLSDEELEAKRREVLRGPSQL